MNSKEQPTINLERFALHFRDPRFTYGSGTGVYTFPHARDMRSDLTKAELEYLYELGYGSKEAGYRQAKEVAPCRIGAKPEPTDELTFFELQGVPNLPNLAIRVWGGDLARLRSFSFDFFNRDTEMPINTPPNVHIYMLSSFPPGCEVRLQSVAAAFGVDQIVEGGETFFANEGTSCRVVIEEQEGFRQLLRFTLPLWQGNNLPPQLFPLPFINRMPL